MIDEYLLSESVHVVDNSHKLIAFIKFLLQSVSLDKYDFLYT